MNNTERETKEIVVGEHKLSVLTYLTGRELREIQSVMISELGMKQKGGETEIEGFSGALLQKQEDVQLKIVVKAFDGNTEPEQILNSILDMRAEQYQEVKKYIQEIAGKEPASK